MTMNTNIEPLVELGARIVELEEEISDRARGNRLLDTLKKLFTEAQDHHRKGNIQEARLILVRFQVETNYPRPSSNAADSLGVRS